MLNFRTMHLENIIARLRVFQCPSGWTVRPVYGNYGFNSRRGRRCLPCPASLRAPSSSGFRVSDLFADVTSAFFVGHSRFVHVPTPLTRLERAEKEERAGRTREGDTRGDKQ